VLEEPVTLHKDDIKWRQKEDKRDWIFGVMPEQMCFLLDVEAVSTHFHR